MWRRFVGLALALCIAVPALVADTTTVPALGTARRIVRGVSLPATCNVGDVYFPTAGTVYSHECVAANTWTAIGVAAGAATFITGPASATDNAFVRFSTTTGKLAQNGVITSADWNGDLAGPSALTTTTGVGAAFTNQPANDAIEILSDNALDITQSVTLIGTTTATDTVVVEVLALDVLDGTTPTVTTKVDWGVLMAAKLSGAALGTITIREASGDATITTIAPAALSAGVETVSAANQAAWNRTVLLNSDGATTKQLGLKGTNSSAAVIYDSQALSGTTVVLSNSAFATVTELYTGDLENTRTATQTATAGTKLDGKYVATGTTNGGIDGNAATATALQTARTIGGTSFDGTANIVPGTVTVADTTDATSFVGLFESATGDLAPKTDAGITYDATTGILTTTGGYAGILAANLPAASTTAVGGVELATTAETTTGTDTTRALTAEGLADSDFGKRTLGFKIMDDATTVTTGDGKLIWTVPALYNGWVIVNIEGGVSTVSSSGVVMWQVRNVTDAVDVMSTALTIDASEYHSSTAATPMVINTANDDLATGDRIAFDNDAAGTGAKGPDVWLTIAKAP